jgi:predicted lipoprotein with Yx(FWY)xxD motif
LCYVLTINEEFICPVCERRKAMRTNNLMLKTVLSALVMLFIGTGIALAEGAAIDIKTKDAIGPYLVDARGMTLYVFKSDSPGKSMCAGPCVVNWPVFYLERGALGKGIDATDVGEIKRADGKAQATYKGLPLYRFVGDKAPGDTNGHGIKDVWFVAKP